MVDAGPDADVELPNNVLTMAASVTDDGLPIGAHLNCAVIMITNDV